MNEKLARIKKYVKTHAPQLVTAVATVGTLAVVALERKDRKDQQENWQTAIAVAKDKDWKYDFVPGVGLFVDEIPNTTKK